MEIVGWVIVGVLFLVLLVLPELKRGRVGRNPPANYPPPLIPEPGGMRSPGGPRLRVWTWRVQVKPVGDHVSVRPVRLPDDEDGIGIIQDGLVSYCRTEGQIMRAKERWQAWCDQENAKEAHARDLAARHA